MSVPDHLLDPDLTEVCPECLRREGELDCADCEGEGEVAGRLCKACRGTGYLDPHEFYLDVELVLCRDHRPGE